MKKVLLVLFLLFGIFNLFNFVQSFLQPLEGPLRFMTFNVGLTGYRIKSLAFAAIFFLAFWANLKQIRRKG